MKTNYIAFNIIGGEPLKVTLEVGIVGFSSHFCPILPVWSHKKSLVPCCGKCKNSIKPESLDSLFSLDSVFLVISGRNRYRSVHLNSGYIFPGTSKRRQYSSIFPDQLNQY